MRIVTLGIDGISETYARPKRANNGRWYYAVSHGENGRGRWELRYPLNTKEFPCNEGDSRMPLNGDVFDIKKLNKKDSKGNNRHMIIKGKEDGRVLVFWWLSPGYRGSASFAVSGDAVILAEGLQAQGAAGRVGGASCPVVLLSGDAELSWTRTGRLYGSPSEFKAIFNNGIFTVGPIDELEMEDEIFQ